ncbi:helix-turn-helix domain-containing protein [Undibacterium sp.]|uniref:helix-turn-helix domain-containing protein n=1 Tax=Undibacterium sp. TaxID=1914977 RepID=UPI0025DA31C2|nr:helix-turn-helix domain-containing protein [Undibacterium sp.]
MKKFQCEPLAPLSPYVDRIWGWESAVAETVHLPVLLPGTGAELYFHYGDPFRYTSADGYEKKAERAHLFCVRQNKIALSASANIGFVAVRFKIGMIHRFTTIPGAELMDQVLSVDDMWGPSGAQLLRQLSYAADMQTRLALIQTFLLKKLSHTSADLLAEHAMVRIYRDSSSVTVANLAEHFCLGRRQLERRLMALSGLSPRDIKGLSRFQRTVRCAMLESAENPASLAVGNGYYDQAHFIRDFQKRVGSTPHLYLKQAREKTHFYNTSVRPQGMLLTPHSHV